MVMYNSVGKSVELATAFARGQSKDEDCLPGSEFEVDCVHGFEGRLCQHLQR